MVKPGPKWVAKWRELERLVDRKYEAYCAVVGLSIHQFNEPAIRHFKIHLTFHDAACGELFLGDGTSRFAAICQAIKTVKENKESTLSLTHFAKHPIHEHEMRQIQVILKATAFKKTAR